MDGLARSECQKAGAREGNKHDAEKCLRLSSPVVQRTMLAFLLQYNLRAVGARQTGSDLVTDRPRNPVEEERLTE